MPPSNPRSPRAPDARTDPELRKLFTHVQTGLQAEADLRVKPITRQKKLLEKSVQLGRKAEAELIRRYTYLTRVLHADFARTLPAHVDREDLFAVAQMAALEQIRNYRFDRGADFATIARIRIQGAMKDHLRESSPLSRSQMTRYKILNKKSELSPKERTELQFLTDRSRSLSLETSAGSETSGSKPSDWLAHPGPNPLEHLIASSDSRSRMLLLDLMTAANLSAQERGVLLAVYLHPEKMQPHQVVAKQFGVGESRVTQIIGQAVRKMSAVASTVRREDLETAGLSPRSPLHHPLYSRRSLHPDDAILHQLLEKMWALDREMNGHREKVLVSTSPFLLYGHSRALLQRGAKLKAMMDTFRNWKVFPSSATSKRFPRVVSVVESEWLHPTRGIQKPEQVGRKMGQLSYQHGPQAALLAVVHLAMLKPHLVDRE